MDVRTVDVEEHTMKIHFQYSGMKVCHFGSRIGFDMCLAVLYHKHTIAVICVDQGKCFGI